MTTILKNTVYLSVAALLGLAFVWQAPAETHMSKHEVQSHKSQSSEGQAVIGEGVIHSVSPAERKVNLTHEPIPALNWPGMTMDLDVAEGVDLQQLDPGDNIQFYIELGEDKVYRITEVMK